MLPQEVLNQIDRVIKETWIHKISKDYADWYMLKEDSLKCCMYYHLRSQLDDLLREHNLRIYPEFYFGDLAYFADLAIVQVDPDSEEEYLTNAVTDIIAIIELKYTAGTADRTATWVKKDVAKMKDYIQTGKLSCRFYFAVIYEVECSSLRWMDRRSTNNWASGYVTELDAGYINDEMRFEVNAYNGMNEDIK